MKPALFTYTSLSHMHINDLPVNPRPAVHSPVAAKIAHNSVACLALAVIAVTDGAAGTSVALHVAAGEAPR